MQRVETTIKDGKKEKPVVYFVAHIYERGYDSFRAGFGSWRHNGIDRCDSKEMAKNAKAVLWITGDNLIQMDTDKKGILIRNCSNYRALAEGWYRVAVKTHEENEQLLAAMREVCE